MKVMQNMYGFRMGTSNQWQKERLKGIEYDLSIVHAYIKTEY
jgi:hypothetical protein